MKLILILLLVMTNKVSAQHAADDILGTWLTAGKEPAKIQVYKSGDKYYGKIIWLKNLTESGKARTDKNNPDKNKRDQPIIGLVILQGFSFDGRNEWENGTIYDPENGKTYSCNISLKENNLKVRGYIGISLLGRTEIWTRSM